MFITNKGQLGSQYSIHIKTVFLYLLVDPVKRFVHCINDALLEQLSKCQFRFQFPRQDRYLNHELVTLSKRYSRLITCFRHLCFGNCDSRQLTASVPTASNSSFPGLIHYNVTFSCYQIFKRFKDSL